jgi:hypothetical protein
VSKKTDLASVSSVSSLVFSREATVAAEDIPLLTAAFDPITMKLAPAVKNALRSLGLKKDDPSLLLIWDEGRLGEFRERINANAGLAAVPLVTKKPAWLQIQLPTNDSLKTAILNHIAEPHKVHHGVALSPYSTPEYVTLMSKIQTMQGRPFIQEIAGQLAPPVRPVATLVTVMGPEKNMTFTPQVLDRPPNTIKIFD